MARLDVARLRAVLRRLAAEALTNAAKHAPGAPVAVLLTYQARMVRLVVSSAAPTRPRHPGGRRATAGR